MRTIYFFGAFICLERMRLRNCEGGIPENFLNIIAKYAFEEKPVIFVISSKLNCVCSKSFFASLICKFNLYSIILKLVALRKHFDSHAFEMLNLLQSCVMVIFSL